MKTVDEAIREMDDLDGFLQYLHQTGASHRKIPGFKPELFWVSSISKARNNPAFEACFLFLSLPTTAHFNMINTFKNVLLAKHKKIPAS